MNINPTMLEIGEPAKEDEWIVAPETVPVEKPVEVPAPSVPAPSITPAPAVPAGV